MTVSAGFLIYATLYRLTVLAVGALAIWLGFRLFNKAESKAYDNTGSASAEGGGFKLTLTSILPGTYFALFGTVMISVMLWNGEPQLVQEEIKELTSGSSKHITRVLLRGIIEQEWKKLGPNVTLKEAAAPLSIIARNWQQQNRIGEAIALANLAAQYGKDEDRVKHLDLLAELLRANGDEEGAAQTEQNAAALRGQEE